MLGIGHERRYEPAMEEMRRLFESGELGRLLHMDANVSHSNFRKMDPSNWRRDPRHAPAGAWTALGIHLGDMFVSLAGPPTRVAARTASQIFPAPSEDFVSAPRSISPTARAGASPACRRRRSTDASRSSATRAGSRCRKAAMSTKASRRVSCIAAADGSRQTRSYHDVNTVRLNFEAWADAVEGRAPYRFSTEQLLGNIRILDAVVRSAAADGKPITL